MGLTGVVIEFAFTIRGDAKQFPLATGGNKQERSGEKAKDQM